MGEQPARHPAPRHGWRRGGRAAQPQPTPGPSANGHDQPDARCAPALVASSGRGSPLILRILAWPLVLTVMSSLGLFLYSLAFLQLTSWAEIASYWAVGLISARLWLEDFFR